MSSRRNGRRFAAEAQISTSDGAALRVHRRRQAEHPRRKSLPRKGVGDSLLHSGRAATAAGSVRPLGRRAASGRPAPKPNKALPGCTICPGSTARCSTRASGRGAQCGLREARLRRRRGGSGHPGLCLRTTRLKYPHRHWPALGRWRCAPAPAPRWLRGAYLVELRRTVEPLGHQLLGPRQRRLGRALRGLGLCQSVARVAVRALLRTPARRARAWLSAASACPRCGTPFLVFKLHQHIARAHGGALQHAHPTAKHGR